VAAVLLGLNPFYWDFSRLTLAEGPLIVWLILSLLLVDRVWAERAPRPWEAALSGLFAGAIMMIKGSLFGLALAPLGYMFGGRGTRLTHSRQVMIWAIYLASFTIFFLAWFIRDTTIDSTQLGPDGINQLRMLFAINATDPASPLATPLELLQRTLENVMWRIIYRVPEQLLPGLWMTDWQNWPHANLLALTTSSGIFAIAIPWNKIGMPLFVSLVPSCVLLAVYDGGARFWIPISIPVLLLIICRLQS